MQEGENSTGGRGPLTVEDAAVVLEGLLSPEEETQPSGQSQPDGDGGGESPDPEGESEGGQAGEEAGEGAEGQDDQQPKVYRVKVDGEEIEVTLEEALKGYSRLQDYTRKTQKLADERKAFEAERESVRAERQKYAEQLKQVEAELERIMPKEPDWDTLQREYPDQYPRVWAAWQQYEKQREKIRAEIAETEMRQAAEFQQLLQQYVAEQSRLLIEKIPEWKDPDVAKAERQKLVDFALEVGFTPDEIERTVDHRAVVLLRDAMKYRELKKAKPPMQNKTASKVKPVTPGSAKGEKAPVSPMAQARQRLAKTGSVHDAAAVFMHMLDVEESAKSKR